MLPFAVRSLEVLLFLLLLAGAARVSLAGRPLGLRALGGLGVLVVSVAAAAWAGRASAGGRVAPIAIERADSGSVGSGACRSCHPAEYASWHRSFHRTMTQVATPAAVRGPWEGVKVEVAGRTVELSRKGEELWARVPDPDVVAGAIRAGSTEPEAGAPLVSRRVLLTTGSHHHQVYWVGGERGNELRLLPITYLIADGRYVARRDAFLQPPDAPPHAIRWNSNCIQCHATRGEPRLDEPTDRFASSAAELGIACEACHGPGAEHVRKEQNPLIRFTTELTHAADRTITNPYRLGGERASEVCGQCHAYFVPRDEDRWWTAGFADFRPGDALAATRTLLTPAAGASVEADVASLFWRDGTIRVGGRELNGLEESACFLRGEGKRKLSCLSCHSMHDSEPDDQLRRTETVDTACVRCHDEKGARRTEHTHHAAASAGSSCVGCHMPFTSYALFTAIRSHRIDSPSARRTAEYGRPNACNLCHVDRTLAWTDETLRKWYGENATGAGSATHGAEAPHDANRAGAPHDANAASGDETVRAAFASTTPRAVTELLSGDAATRAVVASAFGRAEARQASSTAPNARLLAELLDDPYAAVRKVACDSLRAQPGFADFKCDFVADKAARRASRDAALRRAPATELAARIDALLDARDQRSTTISE
jgi:predicted CXXCH cytochrome family protein